MTNMETIILSSFWTIVKILLGSLYLQLGYHLESFSCVECEFARRFCKEHAVFISFINKVEKKMILHIFYGFGKAPKSRL